MSFHGKDFRTRPVKRLDSSVSAHSVSPLRGSSCAAWAMLLPDAAEGLLSEPEQRALEQHLSGCAACSEELAEAQRGLAWLTVLKDQTPEPPSTLLSTILAQTTGMPEAGVFLPPLPVTPESATIAPEPLLPGANVFGPAPAGLRSWREFGQGLEGLWAGLLQPRLAMTAAMAFFSICVTLNLLGFSVRQLDAQTLRSGGLHRTVADTSASLVRSIEGLRVVYRVESHVNEMRAQMDDTETAPDH